MRPDYDGVKFYGKEDMGNAIQLKKADSIIFAFNKNSEYTDINAVIELYNIQQLYDAGITLKTWTKEECFNRKQIVNSMTSAIGRLFSKINAQFKKIVALSNLIQRIYHNDIRNMLP